MSQRSQGSGTGIAIVLVIALFGGLGFLALLGVAGAAFFWLSAGSREPEVVWQEEGMIDPSYQISSVTDDSFPLGVETATRQPDGSWKIFVSGRRARAGKIEGIHFTNVRIVDLPAGDCQVALPTGPFSKTIDFVIHTPPLPANREQVRIEYVLHVKGANAPGDGFSESSDGVLNVDLTHGPSKANKAEALPE